MASPVPPASPDYPGTPTLPFPTTPTLPSTLQANATPPNPSATPPLRSSEPSKPPVSEAINQLTGGPFPKPIWVWQALDANDALSRDPAGLPKTFGQSVKVLREGKRGPKSVKIAPAVMLKVIDSMVVIKEDSQENYRKVNYAHTIPYYEGLLLLDELLSRSRGIVAWPRDLASALEKARAKLPNQRLSAATYVKRNLLDVAVTGPPTTTTAGHRRNLIIDKALHLEDGVEGGGFWKVLEVAEYLPPWLAFTHPNCGIYQDFYLIRWAPPHNNVDFSTTESGYEDAVGATWEPDECLPIQLDGLRQAAKRKWVIKRQTLEANQLQLSQSKRLAQAPIGGPAKVAKTEVERSSADEQDEGEDAMIWEQLVNSMASSASLAKRPEDEVAFKYTPGQVLAQQVVRLLDACHSSKRGGVATAISRMLILGPSEGADSAKTRISTKLLTDLSKKKVYKLDAIYEILQDLAKSVTGENANEKAEEHSQALVAWILVYMFPQPDHARWGWAHRAWTWDQWWILQANCVRAFPPIHAYSIMVKALELMISVSTSKQINEMPVWKDKPKHLSELRRRMGKMSGKTEEQLIADLSELGIHDQASKLS